MKKNAFSLVELIATVAILCIVFLFVAPRIVDVIKDNENQNKEILETRVVESAKEYVISYDKTFLDSFIAVGTVDYIELNELVGAGLIDESDANELGSVRVRVELLANDKLNYSIEYTT